MMDRESAIKVRKLALEAVSRLSQILAVVEKQHDKKQYEQIKRGVGLSIGSIQMEVLEIINAAYPDLDDLK